LRLQTKLQAKVFAQEVNVNSTHEGPWRWSFGGIYRDGNEHLFQLFGFLTPRPVDFTDTSQSFAVFGELTHIAFNGLLETTAGLRYFEDDVTQRENVLFSGVPGVVPLRTDTTFTKASPRFVLTLHPSNHLTAYVSYSEGFRSGSDQNPIVTLAAPGFKPLTEDNLKNYEFGVKGSPWQGRLSFDAAVFYIDWEDVQQPLQVAFGPTFVTGNVNGGSASGMGAEFGVTAQPVDSLTVGINFSWSDLQNDTDVISLTNAGPRIVFPEGSRLNSSPEYTAGGSADYAFAVGSSGYEGTLSVSANYLSKLYSRRLVGTNVIQANSDALLFGRVGFSIESPDRWTATLYADNVTNEEGAILRGGAAATNDQDLRPRPRTIGLQLEFGL
jgi:outer membrane receptor protein involved in Fe transport